MLKNYQIEFFIENLLTIISQAVFLSKAISATMKSVHTLHKNAFLKLLAPEIILKFNGSLEYIFFSE